MASHSQISEELAAYLNGAIDLDSFEDWIVVNTWNIHLAHDSKAEKLAFAIEESFAEFSSGHLSEAQVRQEFRSLLLEPRPSPVLGFVVTVSKDHTIHSNSPSPNGSLMVIEEPGLAQWGLREWGHQVLV